MTALTRNKVIGAVNPEKRAAAIETLLMARARPNEVRMTSDAYDFAELDLIGLARAAIEAEGGSTKGLDKMELAGIALAGAARSGGMASTSDFPSILANVASKSLLKGYDSEPQTFRPFTRVTSAPDFRPQTKTQIGDAPALVRVNEHGEFRRGTIGEGKVEYSLMTFGRVFGITRQALINDDLGAFTDVPRLFGVQASALESDLVWGQFLGAQVGSDGLPLFDTGHGNIGTASGITVDSVAAGFEAMRLQKGLDGRTRINLRPAYLITSVGAQLRAEQFLESVAPGFVPTGSAYIAPAYLRALTLISEPRLDAGLIDPATGATIAGARYPWFLAADPARAETLELAHLRGEEGPQLESRQGFDVDGLEWRVRLDAAAKIIDWRSFWKNPAVSL